jgi:hypothetical protein
VQLPTVNEEEVRNMAELQAVKYLPYSQEEMAIAYKIIEVTQDGYTNILLILAQRKSVNRYLEIFRYAGIPVEKITLSSEGLLNWYLGLKLDDRQPIALLDLDSYHTHIQIFRNKKLFFSRSISFDTLDPDSDRTAILREIRLSFDLFLREQDKRVSRIILSGREEYSVHFSSFISDNFSIPCERIEQLRNIKTEEDTTKFLQRLKDNSYTGLLGIALEPEKLTIDLLPRDIVVKRRERLLKKELIKTAVLLCAILVVAFGIVKKKMSDESAYLRKIDAKLKKMEPEVNRLSKLKESIELIQNQLMFKGSSIDILRELYTILPDGISLTLFEFDDKSRILIRGTTKELSKVFKLLPILEKSPYFENARINYATKRTFKQKEFADFEIICALK